MTIPVWVLLLMLGGDIVAVIAIVAVVKGLREWNKEGM